MKIRVFNHDSDEMTEFTSLNELVEWINEYDSSLEIEVQE